MHTKNIKLDSPPTDVAVAIMLNEIDVCKAAGIKIFKIIHGYGSGGEGGLIKKECSKALLNLKQRKVIADFISGSSLSINHPSYKLIKTLCPEVIADADFNYQNAGMTIIIINKD